MRRGYSFRPRLWALALAAAACAAGIALGNWQSRRADEKRAAAAQLEAARRAPALELGATSIDPAGVVGKRVAARGAFEARHTVLLDNKQRGGRVGYEVVTPLRIAGGALHVLVNRGWIEAGATRAVLPEVRTPEGEVHLEGLALERFPQAYEPGGAAPQGAVRQNVRVEAFGAERGLALQPFVIEQWSDTGDRLLREWTAPDFGIEKHDAYALQWYSLAALAVALAVVLSFRRDGPAAD
jgi:surfeit locus 1 family protein